MSYVAGKLWAIKMLFLWRVRLGYWGWDAFAAAWKHARGLGNAQKGTEEPKA